MTRTMDRPATTSQPHRPAAQRLTDRLSRFLARCSIVALRGRWPAVADPALG